MQQSDKNQCSYVTAIKLNYNLMFYRRTEITRRVCDSKRKEIEAGVDGFLVYDTQLVRALSSLWQGRPPNQIDSMPKKYIQITTQDLLQVRQKWSRY